MGNTHKLHPAPSEHDGAALTPIARMAAEIEQFNHIEEMIAATRATAGLDIDSPAWDAMTPEEQEAAHKAQPHAPDGRLRSAFFGWLTDEISDRRDALEAAIALEEPQSLDDVASLAALYQSAVDGFTQCEAAPGPIWEHLRGQDERRVQRLGNAVARGLRRFAGSPLLESGGYTYAWGRQSWPETLAFAKAELAKMQGADTEGRSRQ